MLRNILAGVLGIAIAIVIVFLVTELNLVRYPLPEGLDTGDAAALRDHIATLPIGAFLTLIAGWAVATFVGAVVARRVGTAKAWVYPAVVGGFVFVATVANLIAIPHPHWFMAVSLIAILGSAWLAWFVAQTD
jgi:hypothetical protein